VQLTDNERKELAELGAKLGKQALAGIATVAQADTILAWHRKFANQKVKTSEHPNPVGRPRVAREIEEWVIRMAHENRSWGYDCIQGSLNHLGYTISDQTVGNILKRHGSPPAAERKKTVTWGEFVRSHWDVFVATGFFNSEIWSWFGLLISSLLGCIVSRRRHLHFVGLTLHQHAQQMWSLVLYSLAASSQIQRLRGWSNGSQILAGSRGMKLSEGMRGTVMKPVPDGERHSRSPDMGKVVVLSATRPGPVRDGPIRRQQWCDRLPQDDQGKAA
jgi:hypothetical protein